MKSIGNELKPPHIGIIGGGVAGISAAFAAVDEGANVTLFESSPQLGGRAAAGSNWDTGRHLVSTAYHDFLNLIERLGSSSALTLSPLALGVILGIRKPYWYLNKPLLGKAAPLTGLIGSGIVPFTERFLALPALVHSLESSPNEPSDDELLGSPDNPVRSIAGTTISEHFREAHWQKRMVQRLGAPLARSICNLPPDEAASAPFLAALKRIMNESDKRAGWVRGNAEDLISKPAPEVLAKCGVTVQLKAAVRKVRRENDGWNIETGETADKFGSVIVTVPPSKLGFLEGCEEVTPLLKAAEDISCCTIITVRARFEDVEGMPGPLAELSENDPVWFVEPSPSGGVSVERVISGLPGDMKIDPEKEKKEFLELAHKYFGASNTVSEVEIRHYLRATPSLKPGTGRPAIHQAEGFYYAGDWSDTGLPPTLESAARSGRIAGKAATENILQG